MTPGGDLISLSQSFAFVIGRRVVLVDTCIGNDKERPELPRWNGLQSQFLHGLAQVGIRENDVTDVLCTHLHADHVGWNTQLVDGKWVPTFPRARHYFSRTEYDSVAASLAEGPNLTTRSFMDSVRPIVESGQAVFVDDRADLGDGISLVPTPGHTPGHVSIRIARGATRLLITGDAIHHPLQLAYPDWSTNIDHDPRQAAENRKRLLSPASAPGAMLAGTHFAEPSIGKVIPTTGRAYKFEGVSTSAPVQ